MHEPCIKFIGPDEINSHIKTQVNRKLKDNRVEVRLNILKLDKRFPSCRETHRVRQTTKTVLLTRSSVQ